MVRYNSLKITKFPKKDIIVFNLFTLSSCVHDYSCIFPLAELTDYFLPCLEYFQRHRLDTAPFNNELVYRVTHPHDFVGIMTIFLTVTSYRRRCDTLVCDLPCKALF